jgi:restriction endonuclease S subunit
MSDLPTGWSEENLVSCLDAVIDYRGKTPKKADKGIVTLSAKSVKMGNIDYSQAYYISEETYKSFMVRGFPKKGDILMTTEAPLGCIAKLDRDNISVAQRLLTLRGKDGVLDNDYLMYYLTSRIGQHELHSRASGSTVQGIKRSEFEYVNIILPTCYEEQKVIAKILSSFDEKIELLREQNETLETIAQTIFKELIMQEDQSDWEEVTLDNITEKITDGSYKSPKTVDLGHPMASVKDMYQWGINIDSCRKITKNDYIELVKADCRPLKNDILISKDGSYLKHIFGSLGFPVVHSNNRNINH